MKLFTRHHSWGMSIIIIIIYASSTHCAIVFEEAQFYVWNVNNLGLNLVVPA